MFGIWYSVPAVYFMFLALASNVTNIGLSQMGISGMLGLAFPTIASISSDQGIPLIFNILNNLDVGARFFAFRLGRDIGSTLGQSSFMIGKNNFSLLLNIEKKADIGQHDPIVPDPAAIRYIPVYPKDITANTYDYWKIPLDAIIVNNRSLSLSRSRISSSPAPICVFDSGTSLMVGPPMDVARFYSMLTLGSPQKDESGHWMLDCNVAVDLLVVLGGRAFPIHPLDVSWDKLSDGRGRCTGGIQANDGVLSGDWLFGDTVMRVSLFVTLRMSPLSQLGNNQNIYTSHFIETFRSPPLLGLYSMTTPSNSLRQFVLARGSQVSLEPNAFFSDSVLQISYSSFYSLDSKLDFTALSNNGSAIVNDSIPLDYYERNNDGGHSGGPRWGRDAFVCVLAATIGFAAGALLNVVRTIFVGPRRVREPSRRHHHQQQQQRNIPDHYTTLTKRQYRLDSRWTNREFGAGASTGGSGNFVGGKSSGRHRMGERTSERSTILSQGWTRGSSRSQRKGEEGGVWRAKVSLLA